MNIKRISLVAVLVALTSLALIAVASAQQQVPLKTRTFEFVGTAAQCAPSAAGTDTVEAAWVTHAGLPDPGNSNHALFLQKFGATSNCAAAGATIQGVTGITFGELGFDVRNDGHCGAGAPRFNVVMSNDGLHFIGCSAGPVSGLPLIDPQGHTWTRKLWTAADLANLTGTFAYPAITLASGTVVSIDIIFDEGTDAGPGLTYLDNIDVNGVLIGKPGLAKP